MKYAKNIQYDIKIVEKEITLIDLDKNGNPIGTHKEVIKEEVPLFRTEYFDYEATEEEIAELNKPMPREVEIEQIHKALEDTDYKWGKWLEESTLGLPLSYTMEEIHEEKQRLRDRLHELGED